MVPKWPKPHPRRMKVGANEGNKRASGRITHDSARVWRTHECSSTRAIHTSVFPVTLAGGMVGYTVLAIPMRYSKGVAQYLKQLNFVIRKIN